jgi:hypothetical protein
LQNDQHNTHIEGKGTQTGRKSQTQGVGQAGDGGGSQIGFGDKTDAKRVDNNAD